MTGARELFREERARFLGENPDIEQVEILLTDTNGIPRGKWLPVSALDSLERDGFRLPVSVLGETPSFGGRLDSEYGLSAGDPDGICAPVPGTLKRIPWRERPAAQLLVSMCDDDGTTPHPLDSRGILARAQSDLARLGLFPVAAVELEFSLYRPASDPDGPLQPLPGFSCNRLYELDALDDLAPFLDAVDRAAEMQGIPLAGMISELAPGQFELNLAHIRDACRVADHAVLFRRLVKRVAKRHGLDATFMAKPDGAKPGNGCHVHLSLVSDTGANRFDEPGAAPGAAGACLRHVVAGLIHTAPDVQLVFAPNVNSLRRFTPGAFAPLQAAWGYDHRIAAVRVPSSCGRNARLEHRIAGSDAQPYLVLAAILGGILRGLEQGNEPPPPLRPDETSSAGVDLSVSWSEATERFSQSSFAKRVFGERFQQLYANMKRLEQSELEREVPNTELKAYFHRA